MSEMDIVVETTASELTAASAAAADKSTGTAVKNAAETACIWLQFLIQRVPVARCAGDIVDLLSVAITATCSSELDLVKVAHDTAVFTIKSIMTVHDSLPRGGVAQESKLLRDILQSFDSLSQHGSWRVRETTLKCLSILMANNWPSLSADQRKVRTKVN